jgi:hypothetical protein
VGGGHLVNDVPGVDEHDALRAGGAPRPEVLQQLCNMVCVTMATCHTSARHNSPAVASQGEVLLGRTDAFLQLVALEEDDVLADLAVHRSSAVPRTA